MQMPQFAGKAYVNDYLDWESKVEGLFEYYEIKPLNLLGIPPYGGRILLTLEEGMVK